jgi:membrane-associated phospholipid phosphatase
MLSLWLAGKTQMLTRFPHLWLLVLNSLPLVLALFIAISRIVDYYHWPVDVLAGIVLGSFIGATAYRFCFSFLFCFPRLQNIEPCTKSCGTQFSPDNQEIVYSPTELSPI